MYDKKWVTEDKRLTKYVKMATLYRMDEFKVQGRITMDLATLKTDSTNGPGLTDDEIGCIIPLLFPAGKDGMDATNPVCRVGGKKQVASIGRY